ncbi:dephospho-CoA kinase [Pseudobacteriovorax antillogorgiicola]|uniref:Dephospho-CoA kinase n=1 Tax=Pseudobacteriovorax antillogorgiicola TaxID=1513793 RepID=A0A1Y6BNZ8_9BACT|nr:dephospho-CoA kinase [Pseudobacteriovorax antillogorgiicola]TCS53819.1 dephospho-CoA kinase [Pseudobacteriovorax antillogorgiicola]SMF21908.1 dephospho-CoA kinase [Pseudobacteriovorax antillogorgiicola]
MDYQDLCKQYGIALTGGIACGKSTVAGVIRDQGYLVVDADQLARQVVAPGSPGLKQIAASFGHELIDADGQLRRAEMRRVIASDPNARSRLEAITHPLIHQAGLVALTEAGITSSPKIWFYEAALIFEIGREHQFHDVWVAHCPHDIQMKRLMTRDSCSQSDAEKMIAAQLPVADKVAKAGLAIDTDLPMEELTENVKTYLQGLKRQNHES